MNGTCAFVAVGSNLAPEQNVPAALALLERQARLLAVSTFYRTPALGPAGGPEFLNGVVELETGLAPRELKFGVLRGIEAALGRRRAGERFAPRTIDLDLVLFGDLVMDEPGLALPDPAIERRAFVALPLLELAPGLRLPGSGRPLAEVVAELRSRGDELLPGQGVHVQW